MPPALSPCLARPRPRRVADVSRVTDVSSRCRRRLWTLLWLAGGCSASTSPTVAAGARTEAHQSNPEPAPRRPVMPPRSGRSAAQRQLEAAVAAAKAGDLPEALRQCRGALEEDPKLEHAYLLAGSICGMQRNLNCEQSFYDRGLAALPELGRVAQGPGPRAPATGRASRGGEQVRTGARADRRALRRDASGPRLRLRLRRPTR